MMDSLILSRTHNDINSLFWLSVSDIYIPYAIYYL